MADDDETQDDRADEGSPHVVPVQRAEGVRAALASGRSGGFVSPFGNAGPRRCSFCDRREDAVMHLVAARGVYICELCSSAAHQLISSAPSGKRMLRLRPPRAAPKDREAAEEAIRLAFETVFGDSSIGERCAAIAGGADLVEAMQVAAQRFPAHNQVDVSIEYVRFLDPDEAEVHFVLYLPGQIGVGMPRMPHTGFAVKVGDLWMVARETWCQVVAPLGVQCPPPSTP